MKNVDEFPARMGNSKLASGDRLCVCVSFRPIECKKELWKKAKTNQEESCLLVAIGPSIIIQDKNNAILSNFSFHLSPVVISPEEPSSERRDMVGGVWEDPREAAKKR